MDSRTICPDCGGPCDEISGEPGFLAGRRAFYCSLCRKHHEAAAKSEANSKRRILLWDLWEPALVVEHPSGVVYQNQVGGNVCWQADLEGVLAPIDLGDIAARALADYPYPTGSQGISSETADVIDAILAADLGSRFIQVDRARLGESWEAWVHVLVGSSERDTWTPDDRYPGPLYGFGRSCAVLTWQNSD